MVIKMREILDKSFILLLIILAAVALLVSMVTGPFGEDDISIGAAGVACVFSLLIIIFGISTWDTKNKDKNIKK